LRPPPSLVKINVLYPDPILGGGLSTVGQKFGVVKRFFRQKQNTMILTFCTQSIRFLIAKSSVYEYSRTTDIADY
jgi:hypothetical protein